MAQNANNGEWSGDSINAFVVFFFDKEPLIAWATNEGLINHPIVVSRLVEM